MTRRSTEAKLLGNNDSVYAKYLLIAALVVPSFLALFPVVIDEVSRWQRNTPSFEIERNKWGVYFDESGSFAHCGDPAKIDKKCPFYPSESMMWKTAKSFSEVRRPDKIRSGSKVDLWLGAEVQTKDLVQTAKVNPNYFVFNSIPKFQRIFCRW